MDINRLENSPGPTVYGEPTEVHILSKDQLERCHFLPGLLTTVNTAYALDGTQSHLEKPDPRLNTIDDFFSILRDFPEAFTVIISPPHSNQVIGTATARRYRGPNDALQSPYQRRSKPEEGCDEWELKSMATDPAAQGQGIASFMMQLIEKEVIRRTQNNADILEVPRGGRIRGSAHRLKMTLCTPLEFTGSFYTRKGYTEDYRVLRGDGRNFHIVFMSKIVEVPSS